MNDDRLASALANDELRALRAALLDALTAGAPQEKIDGLVEQVNLLTRRLEREIDGA